MPALFTTLTGTSEITEITERSYKMLVELVDTKGNTVYVNPDHVALVSGSTLVGESAVILGNGVAISIKGSASEIRRTIDPKLLSA